jgi:protein phosphatase
MEQEALQKAGEIFEKESRLIELTPQGKVVFVGDTHGDLNATQQIIERYLKKPNRIVFLGDYVDRGDYSEENIYYLLQLKQRHPEDIFLLAGNHEGYAEKELAPANFWDSLSPEEKKIYGFLFSKFPLAVTSPNGILALHGGLPDLKSLGDFNRIEWGDEHWDRILWGDFVENEINVLDNRWGRPQLGQPYFEQIMERYQKQVLIRSHQPRAPLYMFKKRCVTIFTSHVYRLIRTVVIADLEREIQTAEDMVFERV